MARKNSSGMPVWGWVLLGVGGFVLVGGGLACAGFLWLGKKTGEVVQQQADEAEQDVEYVKTGKADMTVMQFRANKPDKPTTVRAKVRLASMWVDSFRGTEKTHYSFSISGSTITITHAWADKKGVGADLYELCKDGKDHWSTLVLHRVGPDGQAIQSRDDSILIESARFN